jgi:hypothetical protein
MSSIFLSRNARLICQFPTAGGNATFEIPILEGFSFSQSTNTAEVTLSEATSSGVSRRGRKIFNNSLAPVEFSFSTYARPFKSAGNGITGHAHDTAHTGMAVEAPLWAMLSAAEVYDASTVQVFDRTNAPAGNVITSTTTDGTTSATMTVDFARSQVPQLVTTAKLTFEIEEEDGDGVIKYQLDEAVMNECTMDFDIEGIATLSWSGMAKSITELGTSTVIAPDVTEGSGIGTAKAGGFIQNRLSTLTVDGTGSGNHSNIQDSYDITLTGGSITISNNISFLTPEEIGRVNSPIGHVTGTRTISGSLTCYLDHKSNGSADLFQDISSATSDITNDFDLDISIGGATGPAVNFNVNQANLQIPTHSFDDVVSVEVTFDALPSSLNTADELTVVYTTPTDSLT